MNVGRDHIDTAFEKYDADKSGKLEFEDFKLLLKVPPLRTKAFVPPPPPCAQRQKAPSSVRPRPVSSAPRPRSVGGCGRRAAGWLTAQRARPLLGRTSTTTSLRAMRKCG